MGIRQKLLATFAGQLGHPRGVLGRGVARMLNRGNLAVVTAAVEASGVRPGDTAADIGFGGGIGLSLLLDRVGGQGAVRGVEISASMLDRARRRFRSEVAAGRLTLHEGSLTGLPLPDASLDAVVTTNTVYFVPDLEPAFAEVARVLRPSGRLVVGVGDPDMMAKLPMTPYGFRLRPVADLVTALKQAGLRLEEHRRVGDDLRGFHLLVARPG